MSSIFLFISAISASLSARACPWDYPINVDASWTTDTVDDTNYLGYDLTTDMVMGVCCDAVLGDDPQGVEEDSTVGTSMLHELGYMM